MRFSRSEDISRRVGVQAIVVSFTLLSDDIQICRNFLIELSVETPTTFIAPIIQKWCRVRMLMNSA